MSKEKQKFFRSSAFNAGKKRSPTRALRSKDDLPKRANTRAALSNNTSNATKRTTAKTKRPTKAPESEESESESSKSCSSDCSSSSADSDDSSGSDDSDSSARMSESSSRLSAKNLSPIFATTAKKPETTFGSISGINDKETVWGFAAAAAEARKNQNQPLAFNTFIKDNAAQKTHNNNNDHSNNRRNEKSKPGFGQLKGLYDGLSHLFAASSRCRNQNTPNYSLNRRKRPQENEHTDTDVETDKDKKTKAEGKEPVRIEQFKQPQLLQQQQPQQHQQQQQQQQRQQEQEQEVKIPVKMEVEVLKSRPLVVSRHEFPRMSRTNEDSDGPAPQRARPPMTPSDLVKTAVNSKRHEFERRKFFKSDAGLGCSVGFAQCAILEDARMKKRNLIAEATQTNPPLSVLPQSNNQTGKRTESETHPYNKISSDTQLHPPVDYTLPAPPDPSDRTRRSADLRHHGSQSEIYNFSN